MMGILAAGSDSLSGTGDRPCADRSDQPAQPLERLTPAEKFAARQLPPPPSSPVGELQRYGRMLRPFPTRKLVDVLYYVEADEAVMAQILRNLLIDPPQRAEPWTEALSYLLDCLDSICERAIEARAQIERMIDTADADAERAAVAMRAITALVVPRDCPQCGGHGGDAVNGNCDACSGTGINPAHPDSPL